ncbi:MAG TPA: hypothetical protein VKB88_20415 [Bryobacteraceae bacterium]|nr:hypothetical protein [Bryobacteraceae bacterium]
MRFRTLALAMAIGFALTAGAEAKKKGPHSTPPSVKTMRKKVKGPKTRKFKGQKVVKARKNKIKG